MNLLASFKNITTFVFDVDGVLTNGTVILLENGLQARTMHVKDGLALQMALKNGYKVIIISGGNSVPVKDRMLYLGVQEVFLGIKDKVAFLENYIAQNNLSWKELLYMGDDLPDLYVLRKAGLSCCPADAVPEVKKESRYIASVNGGYGCVREVIEKVLGLNDHWHYESDIISK